MAETQVTKYDRKVKTILIKHDLVSQVRLEKEFSVLPKPDRSLSENLLETGVIREPDLIAAVAKEVNLPPIDVDKIKFDDDVLKVLTQDLAKYYGVLPISRVGNLLTVAVANPFDIVKLDDVAIVTGCHIRPVITSERGLERGIQRAYNPGAEVMQDIISGMAETEVELKEKEIDEDTIDLASLTSTDSEDGAPIIKLVNFIVYKALQAKASDIHIETFEKHIRVRYRVDGRLSSQISPPRRLANAIISRLKIMADLDIAERRRPQDGKFQLKIEGKQVDFRLSILPMVHGEKAVLRILDSSNLTTNLESLGFEPEALSAFREALGAPYGMILVTGPTGSGKSTTLYSCVREVITESDNIVTVEDPVEYQLDGVNQVPVNVKRGLTFAGALRSILRQDPDTIMIGEIRDQETVEIAVKAALTGHQVFSTLHTNDAASTFTRMIDMGVDPFMVASSVLLVAAQRLGRRLCSHCKQPVDVEPGLMKKYGLRDEDLTRPMKFMKPVGCEKCNNGYKGRFAILEVLSVTERVRRIIIGKGSAIDIKKQAVDDGMITLRRCAMLNAQRGMTSVEEVFAGTLQDE